MKLCVITLTNKTENEQHNVNELEKSLDPIHLYVIRDYDPKIKNLSKLYKTFAFLKTCNTINSRDVLCIVDGHDVLFNRKNHNLNSMMKAFLQYDTDIVFSVETKCAHHSDVAKIYFDSLSNCRNRYLNSGVIFAYKDKYLEFLTSVLSKIDAYRLSGSFSDQQVISRFLATEQPDNVKLDYNNSLALTLNTSTDMQCEDIKACFVHVTFLANFSQLLKYQTLLKYIWN